MMLQVLACGWLNQVRLLFRPPVGSLRCAERRPLTSRGSLVAYLCLAALGCSLRDYRTSADREAYTVVAEKSSIDPRWDQPGFTIGIDRRSRYYDHYDPDRPPMPPDDPASHQFMHHVDGKKGWKHWHRFGDRPGLENPCWITYLPEYVDINEEGKIILTLDSALTLAYLHSPTYQQQLETVYLSALDVTTERFRFDTQFFGGNTNTFEHLGRLRGPAGELNTYTTSTDLQAQRRFATAGEMVVGFANSFVWQFAGPNTNSSASILNFNLVQPLLRGAGRDRALEQLTRVERGLLGNLRELERYRQGFYTLVSVGNLGVSSVNRLGGFTGGTGLTGFTGTGQGGLGGVGQATGFGGGFFGGGAAGTGAGGGTGLAGGGAGQVGGFIGLLQNLQEIRNSQYSLDLQMRTLALLEANLESGTIDLTQVDQFRQNIETLRAQLLQARAGLQISQYTFNRTVLGLPPDLPVELDDEFIRPFQLIGGEITELQDRIARIQVEMGQLPNNPGPQPLSRLLDELDALVDDVNSELGNTQRDVQKMRSRAMDRLQTMTEAEKKAYDDDLQQIADDLQKQPERWRALQIELAELRITLESSTTNALPRLVGWLRSVGDEVQSLSLIQARARLESITITPVRLEPDQALEIARANRLDYMNNRAAIVDSWRLIAFNADQLQSVLNLQLAGDLRTVGDNPVKFQGPTGSMTASLQFDAPFTRLLERNNYRQALIDYQQSRRRLIQFDDQLHQTLLEDLTNLEQLRANLEIQRRAVVISIRRVDFTRAELNRPLPPAAPGAQASTFGPTAVQSLLSALSDLSNAQNNFMSVWLNYHAERMQLARDLGVMELDDQGRWIDLPWDDSSSLPTFEAEPLPPPVPDDWWGLPDLLPPDSLPRETLPNESLPQGRPGASVDVSGPRPAPLPAPFPADAAGLNRGSVGVQGPIGTNA